MANGALPKWTEDEIILAMEFYYACPEPMFTDSHPKCQEVAACVGRTPGAVDQILRNIKWVDTSGEAGLPNASALIQTLVTQYRNDVPALRVRAAAVRASRNLPPLDCGD